MVLYASFQQAAKLVAVLKWGGGRIYTKNYEYFQALSLGANDNLGGFRKNRYSGRALFYSSLELKFKLFDVKSFFLPGPFGLTTFYDGGRVWQKGERSKTWHSAVGVGFYYLPFNLINISGSIGYSKGEKMMIFNMGTKVNLMW
jgi:outer membrane protein assembly factor BamA